MKVKATVSFAGVVSMTEGEIRDIADQSLLSDLMNAGYIEEIKEKAAVKKTVKRGETE